MRSKAGCAQLGRDELSRDQQRSAKQAQLSVAQIGKTKSGSPQQIKAGTERHGHQTADDLQELQARMRQRFHVDHLRS